MERWKSKDIELPSYGELCKVRLQVEVKAYYLPDKKICQWLTIDEDQELAPKIISWKAIPGEPKYQEL